jgi:protein O-GlcNAc transferase
METSQTAEINLRREAQNRGISPDRLIFAPKLPLPDHLARTSRAHLFLDTLPYNAHTTASDALWVGVPLVTGLGPTFASRVAASLLKAIGQGELIADSLESYEKLALKLATNPSYLHEVRERLARNRESHPLFDIVRFTRHIEAAYIAMWERYQRGEAPKAFAVKRIG